MKVAIFGGTGFVGSYIIDELIKNKHKPIVLVRSGSEHKLIQKDKCKIVTGDLNDHNAIEKTIKFAESVIYTIGLVREFPKKGISFNQTHFEGVKSTVDAAVKNGVSRYILMSANGVKVDGTAYQKTKYVGEEYLKLLKMKMNHKLYKIYQLVHHYMSIVKQMFITQNH